MVFRPGKSKLAPLARPIRCLLYLLLDVPLLVAVWSVSVCHPPGGGRGRCRPPYHRQESVIKCSLISHTIEERGCSLWCQVVSLGNFLRHKTRKTDLPVRAEKSAFRTIKIL